MFGESMHRFLLALTTLLLSGITHGGIEVIAWSRATPLGGTSAAIYGRFTNSSDAPMTVTAVQIDFAHHAMVHETRNEDGIARMRPYKLVIPAAATVELKPDGTHIMLMGMSRRLQEGCTYTFGLSWSDSSTTRHQFLTGGMGQLTPPIPVAAESCPRP